MVEEGIVVGKEDYDKGKPLETIEQAGKYMKAHENDLSDQVKQGPKDKTSCVLPQDRIDYLLECLEYFPKDDPDKFLLFCLGVKRMPHAIVAHHMEVPIALVIEREQRAIRRLKDLIADTQKTRIPIFGAKPKMITGRHIKEILR